MMYGVIKTQVFYIQITFHLSATSPHLLILSIACKRVYVVKIKRPNYLKVTE